MLDIHCRKLYVLSSHLSLRAGHPVEKAFKTPLYFSCCALGTFSCVDEMRNCSENCNVVIFMKIYVVKRLVSLLEYSRDRTVLHFFNLIWRCDHMPHIYIHIVFPKIISEEKYFVSTCGHKWLWRNHPPFIRNADRSPKKECVFNRVLSASLTFSSCFLKIFGAHPSR